MQKKKVLITGCGTGLGKMAAIALAKRGHIVYATTHFEIESQELNQIAKKEHLLLHAFKLDILLQEDREKIRKLDFDTLISNAGISISGSIAEISIDSLKDIFETNVFCNIQLIQIALEKMIQQQNGRIIVLSSLLGRVSMPFMGPYSMTKFSIESFVSALRFELKLLNYPVEVCMIEPGAYATGFNKNSYLKKYDWMEKKSYFKNQLNQLKKQEEKIWNLLESKHFNSIIKIYIKTVEKPRVKVRYTAPFLQGFFIQILRIFGM